MAASASVSIPATSGAFRLRPRFIHINCASTKLCAIEPCDCFFSLLGVRHFNERESARAAGITVGENAYSIHLAVGFESLAQFVLGGVEAEVTHEDIFQVAPLSFANRGGAPEARRCFTEVRKCAESIANPEDYGAAEVAGPGWPPKGPRADQVTSS
jgi:hypothetical protein